MLEVKNLTVEFQSGKNTLTAVNGLNLSIAKNEIVGLVGESGCGKSVSALSILGLIEPPGKIASGEVIFKNHDLLKLKPEELRKIRGKEISMVFQNPLAALNPLFSIKTQMMDIILLHQKVDKATAFKKAIELLDKVKIADAKNRINQYPHQFSGGMAQRVMIAMAISALPSLLIADEPTASLDVTIQAEVLDLLKQLNRELNLAILMISHDLNVIKYLCTKIVVMYMGKVVEVGPTKQILDNPKHPYTKLLLSSANMTGYDRQKFEQEMREL